MVIVGIGILAAALFFRVVETKEIGVPVSKALCVFALCALIVALFEKVQ